MRWWGRTLLVSSWLLTLASCASPLAGLKGDIKTFNERYPGHLVTLQNGDHHLRYAWSGDPTLQPLIFVHGSPGGWEAWVHFLLDPELQKHFQILAVDRPGYGGSDAGQTVSSLREQSERIFQVLSVNKSHLPAILVGHSLGGPIVGQMVMSEPDKVAGVVFVAASVDPKLERTKWYQYPASWWPIRDLIPQPLRVCNEEIRPLKGELERMESHWAEIRKPVIILQGDQDDLVPKENANFLQSHLKPETIVEMIPIPGMNHFVPWKRPDLIIKAIEDLRAKQGF